MAKEISIQAAGQEIVLSSERALYLPSDDALVISDLHLGKATHFQQNGLAIPGLIAKQDLIRLENLVNRYVPSKVIVAGDFFHAAHNREWDLFCRWKKKWRNLSFHLVKGNHDRLKDTDYAEAGLNTSNDCLNMRLCCIRHIPSKSTPQKFEISGHIHPGILLKGMGRQTIRVPCFVVRENQLILPAFGRFTGLDTRYPRADDSIFTLVEDDIVEIQ